MRRSSEVSRKKHTRCDFLILKKFLKSSTSLCVGDFSSVWGALWFVVRSSVLYFCGSHIDLTRLVSQNMPAPHSVSRRKVQLKIIYVIDSFMK